MKKSCIKFLDYVYCGYMNSVFSLGPQPQELSSIPKYGKIKNPQHFWSQALGVRGAQLVLPRLSIFSSLEALVILPMFL